MLKKIHRLTLNRDFRWVFKNGKNFESGLIKIKVAQGQRSVTRFGFIVSKKIANKAHDRNLIKRRLKHAVRFLLPHVKPGFDIAVWPKNFIKKAEYKDIEFCLEGLFKKSLLWSKN